jgi:hypothetical protein
MTKVNFNLRKGIAIVICLAAATMFSACDNDKNENNSNKQTGNGNNNDNNTVAAAFAQFGANLEQVKPNMGNPSETAIQYGNNVDDKVLDRRAVYAEKTETGIAKATGLEYGERMFNYCKSISADGKCYTDYAGNNPTEVATYEELIALNRAASWGYKYNGMWVGVGMLFNFDGDTEIGIQLNGMGTY